MAKAKEETAIVQAESNTFLDSTFDDLTPVAEVPQNAEVNSREGTEDIRRDEIVLPRLAIAQSMSKAMIPSEPKYIPELKLFQLYNDLTKVVYGNEVLVVPVLRTVRRIEFDETGTKPIDMNVPVGDPRLFFQGNEKPRATEFVEYACFLLRKGFAPEQIVVSIKMKNKFNREAARLWNTFVKQRKGGLPIYAGMYRIKSEARKQGDYNFGVYVVENAGNIPTTTPTGAALYQMAKDAHNMLKEVDYSIQREGVDDSFEPGSFEQ